MREFSDCSPAWKGTRSWTLCQCMNREQQQCAETTVVHAVCPFMIYGELVQRWRLAQGAVLRKWPHKSGGVLLDRSPFSSHHVLDLIYRCAFLTHCLADSMSDHEGDLHSSVGVYTHHPRLHWQMN